ncbi:MAG: hypothetical protein FJ102_22520, partial [Deltaproteobacteria bacterium]|nr:hypothetical protein [Deltaproteobacteria bacterium]
MGCAADTPNEAAPGKMEKGPVVATEVRLPVMTVARSFPRDAEFRGLVTMAVELGLADMPGVVAVIPGDSAPPTFLLSRPIPRRQVDARLLASGDEKALELELELCVPGGSCASTLATCTREAPWAAIGEILDGAAATLGVDVSATTRAAWAVPGSKDAYAEMMTGRAAAQLYGLLPPSLSPGDRKDDPVTRAVFLDPGQPLAQWTRARWEMATTVDGGKAPEALAKAQLLRPTSPLLLADQATLAGLTAHAAEALLAWETLAALGDDPRWVEPLARAYLAVDRPREALAALDRLPAESRWDAGVVELRVAATEATGATELDPLLARWQDVAATNPEPVRRRVAARVRDANYADAHALLGALRAREPGPRTDALEVALLLSLGRLDEAANLAPADVATRIRARAGAERSPGAVPAELADDDPARVEAEGEAALATGNHGAA